MPMASCATPVVEGMVVHTRTDRVEQMRLEGLKFLLVNHPLDCPVAMPEENASSRIEPMNSESKRTSISRRKENFPPTPYGTPLIRQWFDRCVMCLRCIQACVDVPGADVLEVAEHGFPSHVKAVRKENCISCGECLHMCPVGALTENLSPIKGRTWQLDRIQTTCTFCGCGCQFELNTLAERKVVKVTTKGEAGSQPGEPLCEGKIRVRLYPSSGQASKTADKKIWSFCRSLLGRGPGSRRHKTSGNKGEVRCPEHWRNLFLQGDE